MTFTVSPRVRKIAAHDPDALALPEYCRQLAFGSGVDLPADLERVLGEVVLDAVELPPGERAILSLRLPAGPAVVFDPVTHAARSLDVRGEPTSERQALAFVVDRVRPPAGTVALRPGPLRLSLENHAGVRALPGLWAANDALHALLGRRRPFLTAKRLLSNQTFRDLYRTDTLEVDQRLKITSLTFLFTDLKGSTELYERVGDLVAFDLVRAHFRALQETVAAEGGAVVKTIGDAVMATFPTPDRAVAAALRMREAMRALNEAHEREDLLLKVGIHEGPCLAVTLNERQDYFGQTVNIAARVQGLAASPCILASGPVVGHPGASGLLGRAGLEPAGRPRSLAGDRGRADGVRDPLRGSGAIRRGGPVSRGPRTVGARVRGRGPPPRPGRRAELLDHPVRHPRQGLAVPAVRPRRRPFDGRTPPRATDHRAGAGPCYAAWTAGRGEQQWQHRGRHGRGRGSARRSAARRPKRGRCSRRRNVGSSTSIPGRCCSSSSRKCRGKSRRAARVAGESRAGDHRAIASTATCRSSPRAPQRVQRRRALVSPSTGTSLTRARRACAPPRSSGCRSPDRRSPSTSSGHGAATDPNPEHEGRPCERSYAVHGREERIRGRHGASPSPQSR